MMLAKDWTTCVVLHRLTRMHHHWSTARRHSGQPRQDGTAGGRVLRGASWPGGKD